MEMSKILYPEPTFDVPNFYKFIQVHETEEEKYVILTKEVRCVLSSLYTKYNKIKK